jgi:pimeloyl-ACP methyl ester carboxylesterase
MDTNGQHVEINGARYYVRDTGPGENAVLLLHGWPDDGTVWRRQVPALEKNGYRVICPDLLGYGQSGKPDALERYTFEALAADIVDLLDGLGVGETHLVAHDYGAVLGWDLATAHPNRFKTYVPLSVGHLGLVLDLSFDAMRWHWYLLFNTLDLAPEVFRAADGNFFREMIRRHPDREDIVKRYLRPGAMEAAMSWEKANPLPEIMLGALTGQIPEPPPVNVPTFGIWSSGDDYVWEDQMKNSNNLVAAEWRYERIDGAGHWFMLEHPDETNRLLLDWLAKHQQ